jgi:hypothetical protein
MVYPNCNNLLAFGWKPLPEGRAVSDLERDPALCKYCHILLSIVQEVDTGDIESVRISDDRWNRPTKGINVSVSFLSPRYPN